MIVARIWRTAVDPRRLDEYRAFAETRSLPMFRQEDGCVGALFCHARDAGVVVTLWRDRQAADALAESPTYAETVAAILDAGFLTGEPTLEVLELGAGFLLGRTVAG